MAEHEKSKKAFVLRLNPDLLKELEKWASDEFRSVNGQIEFLLTRAVKEYRNKNFKDSKQEKK
ncbi:MAG: ribbon-helix-helix domain-containing protein [Chlorobiales bacterium]